jgi:anion-transporting  ArsA/GET3 family ATPase
MDVLNRNLVFVHGKGGVGKTVVSQAVALRLSELGHKTLWVALEDPLLSPGELRQINANLWHLNCHFIPAFEEYASMKIGVAPLTRLFLQNKLMRYLAKAAPGIHELVLLGKIWFERNHYSHVVVDLPSTGYGLAMFQSTENFVKLFQGGPLNRDAEAMLDTFKDRRLSGHLIVALPEEMPLRESLELNQFLMKIFPNNPAEFIINRLFPKVDPPGNSPLLQTPNEWSTPLAASLEEYAQKRYWLENYNLRLWRDEGISFGELGYIPPPSTGESELIVEKLAEQLEEKDYL